LLTRAVPPLPGILVAYGRYAATWVGINEIIYAGEGVTASVAVSRTPAGVLNYHNAGRYRRRASRGHAPATDASLRPGQSATGPGHRCGAGARGRLGGSTRRAKRSPRSNARPAGRVEVFREHNFNVVANPKVTAHLTMRGTTFDDTAVRRIVGPAHP
jgi:hypothetical protein